MKQQLRDAPSASVHREEGAHVGKQGGGTPTNFEHGVLIVRDSDNEQVTYFPNGHEKHSTNSHDL